MSILEKNLESIKTLRRMITDAKARTKEAILKGASPASSIADEEKLTLELKARQAAIPKIEKEEALEDFKKIYTEALNIANKFDTEKAALSKRLTDMVQTMYRAQEQMTELKSAINSIGPAGSSDTIGGLCAWLDSLPSKLRSGFQELALIDDGNELLSRLSAGIRTEAKNTLKYQAIDYDRRKGLGGPMMGEIVPEWGPRAYGVEQFE